MVFLQLECRFFFGKNQKSYLVFGENPQSYSLLEPNDSFQLHNCATLANRNSPSHKCFSICQKVSTDAKTTNPSSDIFGMSSLFILWYFYYVIVVYEVTVVESNWNESEICSKILKMIPTHPSIHSRFHLRAIVKFAS